jgi:predicted kinase
MSKLYLMRGLPGSGKTTKAEEICKKSGNTTIRLNKDLLREMLHFTDPNKPGYKFNYRQEDEVRQAQKNLAEYFLGHRKNVIIDDTNLNPTTLANWKEFAKVHNAMCEVVDLTDVTWQECVIRDQHRMEEGQRYVGSTVIKNMAIESGLIKFEPDSVVICDIDGTIADTTKRQHFLTGEKKDWKSFFANIDQDELRRDIAERIIELYNSGKTIIYMSGRPDIYKGQTIRWLSEKFMSFGLTLIMRGGNDSREDSIVKEEILNRYFPDKSVIHCVFDDRPRVIRMWRKNGLEVNDVGNGVEF